jgi:restriction system protein
MSDYQKEICIHDYLCTNIRYDTQHRKHEDDNILAHTIWGVFLKRKAVCDGISKAFKYLCNAFGIKCIVAKGRVNEGDKENHAWNIVKIFGQPYHVDVTWDLNRYDGESCIYHYLNLPDEMMYLDHTPDYQYPRCSSTIYTYLARENQLFFNRTDFINYIVSCLLHRKKIIDYRLALGRTKKTIDTIINECFEEAVKKASVSSVSVKIEMNYAQHCGRLYLEYKRDKKFDYDLLEGHAFEFFCADLLRYNGFERVQVTDGSGDFGVDILCEFKSVSYAIQCKCYANTVGNKAVQEVFSGKKFYNCSKAVVITNNYFTAAAEETARLTDVDLWDRGRLNELYRCALNHGFKPHEY